MRIARASISIVTLTVGLAGCSAAELALPRPFSLSRARTDSLPPAKGKKTIEFLPWAESEPYFLVVTKETRELAVYDHGKRVRRYPVVLGRAEGRKRFEGDRRTPSGVYAVTRKRAHRKYHRFLDISYPNATDLELYREAVADRLVPIADDGRVPPGPGRLVGIHGSDKEDLNRLGVDWTFGCVSLLNEDVEELYGMIPEGTLVLIRDDDSPFAIRSKSREPGTSAALDHDRAARGGRPETTRPPSASGLLALLDAPATRSGPLPRRSRSGALAELWAHD
jgi:murein L,D-transpeptidase YafK